jgi:protein phosphatase 1 regulatory subunit 7
MTTPANASDAGEQQVGNGSSSPRLTNGITSITSGVAHVNIEPSAAAATDPHVTVLAPLTNGTSSPARSTNGWDGRLRVGGAVQPVDEEHADSTEDSSAEEEQEQEQVNRPRVLPEREVVEGEQIEADEDLLAEFEDDTEEIDLVHCRIRDLSKLDLDRFNRVKRLCFRQNTISEIKIPANFAPTLKDLDFYDNVISHIKDLDDFIELTSLDLSFNKIKHIKRLDHLTYLKDLYFVQNKISKIEGLDGLTNLKNLELGGNRVRVSDSKVSSYWGARL